MIKKQTLIAMLIVCFVFLCSCSFNGERRVEIPRYESKETNLSHGFQDYTDYCKYYYTSDQSEKFKKNQGFKQVTEADMPLIKNHIIDFESWAVQTEYYDRYDFKLSQVKPGDYFHISGKYETEHEDEQNKISGDYEVYYYDFQNHILYYFHTNL